PAHCKPVGLPEPEGNSLRRDDFLAVDGEEYVARSNTRTCRGAARMNVLEHPPLTVRRVDLHERGRDGDATRGAGTAVVVEADMAGAKALEHGYHRGLEVVRAGTPDDGGLVFLTKPLRVGLGAHELLVDGL